MKRKIGRLCMVLGAVLILCAAGLLGYNRWDAARAEKASQEVLGELEQTMQKTITEHQQENETAALCGAGAAVLARRGGVRRDRPADRQRTHLIQRTVRAGVAAPDRADGAAGLRAAAR